jgi:two-component system chemotaxis response regulator CheY
MNIPKAVLIVDDMKTTRIRLRKICTALGMSVFEAGDGLEAIQLLKQGPVDLILSDWNMPNMDGMELLGKIRKDAKHAATPVIFITAESEKNAVLKSLMTGATDYIVKPFPDGLVREKICSTLNIKPKD